MSTKKQKEIELLNAISTNLEALQELLNRSSDHWGYEDPVYRFYHQSFKVYYLQEQTKEIVAQLQALLPGTPLNRWFLDIVAEGTGKEFTPEVNDRWTACTRPILEAFFHARYFLEMVVKYGKELDAPPEMLPSGWAAALYLYDMR